LPAPGGLASPLNGDAPAAKAESESELQVQLNTGELVPQLAFGLYKVPSDPDGESIIEEAIRAGYRHFDTASFYGNEATLGNALRRSGVSRDEFFISSKVWNDAVKAGRAAVRESVERSLANMNFGGYFDLFYVHWPVPGHYVDAYLELEDLHRERKVRGIGLSNFSVQEYEQLITRISVSPAVNQFEVSPLMYRPHLIKYFQERNIVVAASKALNRAACLDKEPFVSIARRYNATPAQVLLRWGCQKGLIVVAKTSSRERMRENRSVLHFALSDGDIAVLDAITTDEDIRAREELEVTRKKSL